MKALLVACAALLLGSQACSSSGGSGNAAPEAGAPEASGSSSGGDSGGSSGGGSGSGSGGSSGSSGSSSGGGSGSSSGAGDAGCSSGGYPGQACNPVGYAAAPGYPGKLTAWTGGDTVSASGTATAPMVYSFYDFVPSQATGGTLVTGSHVKFVGCRFQSNDVQNYNVQVTGSDVTFEYSSVTPLVSLVAEPPHAAWPSAGAGKQLTGNGTGYQIGGNDGYEYGVNIPGGGPVTLDHCDLWGFGNAVVFYATTAPMTVQSCWIHDAADAAAQAYHTDGPGYLNGGTPPQNVTIAGNTIASIGNTNALALQAATAPYANITVTGNYFSGFGYTVDMGLPGSTAAFTHMTFTGNVLGTDLPWVFGPVYGDETGLFHQATNAWSGNTLKVLAGTAPVSGSGLAWTAQQDGQFVWPDGTVHAADF